MSIVTGLGPVVPVRQAPRSRAGARFALPDAARPTAAAATQAVAPSSLLALQETESNDVADREARRNSHSLLAALAEMQRALLGDAGPADALDRLAALARAAPSAADPRLAAIQRSIQVRAAVELARAKASSRAAASV